MSSTITLDNRQELEEYFKHLKLPLSEYSFTNTYLFREVHEYVQEGVFLRGVAYDGFRYLFPLTFPFNISLQESYFPIPEIWLSHFPEEHFKFESLSSDDDYIFSRAKLATFEGRSLAAQRNQMYRFEREYSPEIKEFDPKDALVVLDKWNSHQMYKTDFEECKEAVNLQPILNLMGRVIYSGTAPVGFILAERLLNDMVVIRFSKGIPEAKGITQYMYRAFVNTLPQEVRWINFEVDKGIPGLIKAKSSYVPDHHLKKFRVTPRQF